MLFDKSHQECLYDDHPTFQPIHVGHMLAIRLQDGPALPVEPNGDRHEYQHGLKGPVIYEDVTEFTDEQLKEATVKAKREISRRARDL